MFLHGHKEFRLHPGESLTFADKTLTLEEVYHQGPLSGLALDEQGRHIQGRITRRTVEQFDPRLHGGRFVITHEQGAPEIAKANFLNPYSKGTFFVVITDVFAHEVDGQWQPGVFFSVFYNPLIKVFFLFYGLLFASLLIHVAYRLYLLTQHPSNKGVLCST
ncbi:hypothetical protein GCM10023333_06580 [Ferrimonas pelagia]|uniref:Uncharacterized protein n=2 Tax=Ferrimonas pelagia TaxID=1177826 RepID=A0ABP9EIU2_9GAMM